MKERAAQGRRTAKFPQQEFEDFKQEIVAELSKQGHVREAADPDIVLKEAEIAAKEAWNLSAKPKD